MKDTERLLLEAVKTTVAHYGLAEFSTRKLATEAGINSGLIYHYFDSKEDILFQSYKRENGALFNSLYSYLDEVQGIPFAFRDRVRLHFHRTWHELLSDPDRLLFCTRYYHSAYFEEASDFHDEQVTQLYEKIGYLFADRDTCIQTMYSLLSILYDSAYRVIVKKAEDTPETEERIFSIFYALLSSQILPQPEKK